MNPHLPVAVIGAGPVGLAAAAHLAQRGESFIVLERGPAVGHAMRQWGHVRVFSPWRYNVDRAARMMLESAGWRHPDFEALPLGREIVAHYLEPLASLPGLREHIRVDAPVTAVGRRDYDKVKSAGRDAQPFVLQIEPVRGHRYELLARAIIDASGTWLTPNPLGSGGYPIPGEFPPGDAIHYGIPDVLGAKRDTYAGKTTLVVGSGHSAINTLLDLVALAKESRHTRVVWAVRRADLGPLFGGGEADALAARGRLGMHMREAVQAGCVEVLAPFRARNVTPQSDGRLSVAGTLAERPIELQVDRIVAATGFRPDFSFLREVRLSVDPWLEAADALAPLIDPNVHSCGTVRPHGAAELTHPEKDFYIAGMKAYGRAPTFLLATGYEQVRSVVAELAGDHEAAARVELDLPATGVCSTTTGLQGSASTACCGAAPPESDACCLADAQAKTAGAAGCGCPTADVRVLRPANSNACCKS